jgi:hypothetical protein
MSCCRARATSIAYDDCHAAVASDGHVFSSTEQVEVSALFQPDESVEYLEVALVPELAQAATGPLIGVLSVTSRRLAFLTSMHSESGFRIDLSIEYDSVAAASSGQWSFGGHLRGTVSVHLRSGKTRTFALFRNHMAPKVAAYVDYRVGGS